MNIQDNIRLATLIVTDKPTGGVIGLASDTIDICSMFSIQQNTANQTLALPNPTVGGTSVLVFVKNTGNVSFQMHGRKIDNSKIEAFIFQNGTWDAQSNQLSGNITTVLSNVTPATTMNVGGLYEIAMPASTDVQLRALVGRQAYTLSEGEYPGGSFATGSSVGAIVNATTTFAPVDNNVHVANERNTITIQDVLTNRLFKVTVWRFGPVTGNWSGWVEEIGVTSAQILTGGNNIQIQNGVIHSTTKANAFFSRNTTLASSVNLDITFNDTPIIVGSGIGINGANNVITLTPATGFTKSYKIEFDLNYATNAILNHALDLAFVSDVAQTINGVAVPALGQFGKGTSSYSTTWGNQEFGSGKLSYIITTAVPISFRVRALANTNTPTIGSTFNNRFPTLIVTEL